MAEQVSGVAKPRFTVQMWMARGWSPIGDRMSRRSGSAVAYTSESLHALEHSPPISGEKARAEMGHDPRPTEETVRDIYDWFNRAG